MIGARWRLARGLSRGVESCSPDARVTMLRLLITLGLVVTILPACQRQVREERLDAPRTLTSPYDTSAGEVLWAVVPLRNESGTSVTDPLALSDHLVGAIEEVEGIRCVPLDRTLAAMQSLKLRAIQNPAQARSLAQAMGVDGVVVGSVTAYDPYTPVMGLSLALYARPGATMTARPNPAFNPRELTESPTDQTVTNADSGYNERPLAVWSGRLDAKNHQTLMDLRIYASGRTRDLSAMGWRRYTASMDLYSQFAMYRGVDGLLQQEWTRVARAQMPKLIEPRAEAE
jgi:hypothetical protein